MPNQATASPTIVAPAMTAHGQSPIMPTHAVAMPICSVQIRHTCTRRASSPSLVCRIASVKYWPHTRIDVVATPRVTMCTSSQRCWWITGPASATTSSATSQKDTGRDARRCQLRRPPPRSVDPP